MSVDPLLLGSEDPQPRPAPTADGELTSEEFAFRLGLLAAALVFFHEGFGSPLQHGIFGAAAVLVSALIVLTMLFQWRVLGDWRRRSQQMLYFAVIVVLSWPIAAALSPTLGQSTLPNGLEILLVNGLALMRETPVAGTILGLVQGILSFGFLIITLGILLLGSGENRRGGVLLVGMMLGAICLFFHPSAETLGGFAFLGIFLATQWEVPLLISDRLRAGLQPIQLEFLHELMREGSLGTGETKIYLQNDPSLFAQLVELRLVVYDSIAREIQPGPRLLHDPATQTLETAFRMLRRCVWIGVGLLYFIMPDLIPGPVDDLVVMFICSGAGGQIADWLTPKRRKAPE